MTGHLSSSSGTLHLHSCFCRQLRSWPWRDGAVCPGLPRPESQALARPPFTRDSSAGLTWLWQNPVLLIIGLGTALPYQLQLGATHSAPGHHPRGPFHLQVLQWGISVRFYPPHASNFHCLDSPPPRQRIRPSSYLQKPLTVAPRPGLVQVAGRCVCTRGQNLVAVLGSCPCAPQLLPAAPTRTLFLGT